MVILAENHENLKEILKISYFCPKFGPKLIIFELIFYYNFLD